MKHLKNIFIGIVLFLTKVLLLSGAITYFYRMLQLQGLAAVVMFVGFLILFGAFIGLCWIVGIAAEES